VFRLEVMLTAVRATHEHLDLEVLDALTRNGDRLPAVIEEIAAERAASSQPLLAGTVVISTCNRLEVYLDTEPLQSCKLSVHACHLHIQYSAKYRQYHLPARSLPLSPP